MNRRLWLGLFAILFTGCVLSAETGGRKIRVLIVDGFSNHDWQQTTALIRGVLAQTNLFEVAVSTAPQTTNAEAWDAWHPKFSDCDVVGMDDDLRRRPRVCLHLWPCLARRYQSTRHALRGGANHPSARRSMAREKAGDDSHPARFSRNEFSFRPRAKNFLTGNAGILASQFALENPRFQFKLAVTGFGF